MKNKIDLSEIHDCEKCHGKIVAIQIDMFGNTYCGYCGEKVDYSKWSKEIIKNSKTIEKLERKNKLDQITEKVRELRRKVDNGEISLSKYEDMANEYEM